MHLGVLMLAQTALAVACRPVRALPRLSSPSQGRVQLSPATFCAPAHIPAAWASASGDRRPASQEHPQWCPLEACGLARYPIPPELVDRQPRAIPGGGLWVSGQGRVPVLSSLGLTSRRPWVDEKSSGCSGWPRLEPAACMSPQEEPVLGTTSRAEAPPRAPAPALLHWEPDPPCSASRHGSRNQCAVVKLQLRHADCGPSPSLCPVLGPLQNGRPSPRCTPGG